MTAAPSPGPVGFVGLGTMGTPMVQRLLGAGFDVVVSDVSASARERLAAAGATAVATAADVARRCRIVMTSLPGPAEVADVVGGPGGILDGAEVGDIHVDLSTSSLEAVRAVAEQEAAAGVIHLDAPVSGGAFFAVEGQLTLMVSGPRDALDRVRPVLAPLGEKVFHLGEEPGAGTLVKLVNNAVFLAAGIAAQEGLVVAAKAGLDVDRIVEVLQASSAGMYLGMVPMTLERDFSNAFFALALAAKDIGLAADSARSLGVETPVIDAARSLYDEGVAQGFGSDVFFATLKVLEARAGVTVERSGLPEDAADDQ